MMQNLFNHHLVATAIALSAIAPTPLMLYKDNPKAVLAGLMGGMTAGSVGIMLVTNRSRKKGSQLTQTVVVVPEPEVGKELKQSQATPLERSGISEPSPIPHKNRKRQSRRKKTAHRVTPNSESVIEWLQRHDIETVDCHQPTEADEVWNRIAWYRGKHEECQELVNLHDRIRMVDGLNDLSIS